MIEVVQAFDRTPLIRLDSDDSAALDRKIDAARTRSVRRPYRDHAVREMKMTTPTPEYPIGYDLLRNPRLNKGTAFTEAARRAFLGFN